jgi:hypothetical protein
MLHNLDVVRNTYDTKSTQVVVRYFTDKHKIRRSFLFLIKKVFLSSTTILKTELCRCYIQLNIRIASETCRRLINYNEGVSTLNKKELVPDI